MSGLHLLLPSVVTPSLSAACQLVVPVAVEEPRRQTGDNMMEEMWQSQHLQSLQHLHCDQTDGQAEHRTVAEVWLGSVVCSHHQHQ